MFTGIVESTALLRSLEILPKGGAKLVCEVSQNLQLKPGDSLAVNGCCLTLVNQHQNSLSFDISQETLNRTNLGLLRANSLLNIERPLKLSDFIGGHIVTGHIDGLAYLKSLEMHDHDCVMWISLQDPKLGRYCVHKGSICINGVSLTINTVSEEDGACLIRLDLIPETLQRTNLGQANPELPLNIEVDILAKHLEKLMKS